jgi:hypothetical protein
MTANDPTATLAVHCGNGFDAGFRDASLRDAPQDEAETGLCPRDRTQALKNTINTTFEFTPENCRSF